MLKNIGAHQASALGSDVGECPVGNGGKDHISLTRRKDAVAKQILHVSARLLLVQRIANGVEKVHQILVAVHLLAHDADVSAAAAPRPLPLATLLPALLLLLMVCGSLAAD